MRKMWYNISQHLSWRILKMKNKDYPEFLARAQKKQEQINLEYELANAKVDNVIMKETRGQYMWRHNPTAQSHSWDFYFDELNWG